MLQQQVALVTGANKGIGRELDKKGRPRKDARSVADLALRIHEQGGFRRCTWRQGTQEALSARFALRRVVAAGVPQREQEPLWLLIEWRDGEPHGPGDCHLAASLPYLPPRQPPTLLTRPARSPRSPLGPLTQ